MSDRLRDRYASASRDEGQDTAEGVRVEALGYRRARSWIRWATPLAAGLAVAGVTAGIAVSAMAGGGKHPSDAARSPAGAAVPALPDGGSPVIGKPYSFRLLVHCGVPAVSFGGRAWSPVQPVPKYPGARPVNGITTETGYVSGTMTLTRADTLRFVADARAVLAPFAVVFKPATVPSEGQPCA